jgi:hypothetical protein
MTAIPFDGNTVAKNGAHTDIIHCGEPSDYLEWVADGIDHEALRAVTVGDGWMKAYLRADVDPYKTLKAHEIFTNYGLTPSARMGDRKSGDTFTYTYDESDD